MNKSLIGLLGGVAWSGVAISSATPDANALIRGLDYTANNAQYAHTNGHTTNSEQNICSVQWHYFQEIKWYFSAQGVCSQGVCPSDDSNPRTNTQIPSGRRNQVMNAGACDSGYSKISTSNCGC